MIRTGATLAAPVRRYYPSAVATKLYYFALSHPARAARLMLEHKGISFERKDLLPGTHPV